MELESSVSAHGPGAVCPICGKAEVFEHPDGTLRHCFNCGANSIFTTPTGQNEVLQDIFKTTRQHLLARGEMWTYLVEHRGLHPQVLVDSAIGVIPPDLDVTQLFLPKLEQAEIDGARVLTAPRKPGRPTKKEQEAIDAAIAAVDRLKQTRDELANFFEGREGWLMFVHTDKSHRIARIRLWSAESSESPELSLGLTSGVFNHALFAPGQRAKSLEDLHGRSIVVASEFDALQLQSLGARLAQIEGLKPQAGYLKVAAVGEGIVPASTVRALGQLPLVIRNGGTPAIAARIVDAIRQEVNLFAVTVPGSRTLDEWLREQSSEHAAGKAVLELAATQVFIARPYDAVQAEIDQWRSLEEREVKKFEADRWATHTLVQDISQRGQLFYDGRTSYVFDKGSKELFPMDRDNADTRAFLSRYGVAPSDAFLKHALSAIDLHAHERGQETTVHSLSHYDAATNRLYLFDQDRNVYRISSERIERVDNGTDGVLFVRNAKWTPFEIGTPTGKGKGISETLLGSIRLREESLSRLEQEWLFESWLYAMFFPELFPTRPLLAMIGEKGSGKTSVLRRMGQLLFGPKFQVMGMSLESRDFDAAVTTEGFVVIDNADADVSWLDDKLAVLATGGTLKRRLYYTTNEMVEFPITAFVGLTSRTPHFRREDVADRLLLFHVERLEAFGAEGTLLAELTAQRNALMTELVGELQKVLAALEKHKNKTYPTNFRIADFAQFVLKVADADGRLAEAQAMFDQLVADQLAFTAQDDPVLELLEDWIAVEGGDGKEITTARLFDELRRMTSSSHRAFDFKSARAFGQYLQSNRATLKELFGATDRTAGGRKRLWRFHPPKATEGKVPTEADIEKEKEELRVLFEKMEPIIAR